MPQRCAVDGTRSTVLCEIEHDAADRRRRDRHARSVKVRAFTTGSASPTRAELETEKGSSRIKVAYGANSGPVRGGEEQAGSGERPPSADHRSAAGALLRALT